MDTIPNEENQIADMLPIYESARFEAPATQKGQRGSKKESPVLLTVVNTKRNGMRIAISPIVMAQLGSPETIQIAIGEDGIALAAYLPDNQTRFEVKKMGNKAVIYCAPLVREVTEIFDLDFSGRTSISFSEISYMQTVEGQRIAFFQISERSLQVSVTKTFTSQEALLDKVTI
ncbi:hypothetical protein [Paenibacillus camerounensis]|uniref:hypothetical protein n=1 Tax=Paenibacillus camerounensis TaxID=1243663 RepID=UPI000694A4C4|nr:hypothetical protein [Paenibacillus camerounensis]